MPGESEEYMTYKRILKEIDSRINYLKKSSKELELKTRKLCEGLTHDDIAKMPDNHPIIVKKIKYCEQITDISGEICALSKLTAAAHTIL